MVDLGTLEEVKPASALGCNGRYGINGIYVGTQYHPPPYSEPTDHERQLSNPLAPTCREEAEALKKVPPPWRDWFFIKKKWRRMIRRVLPLDWELKQQARDERWPN